MIKKTLYLFIALLMLISVFAFSANAAQPIEDEEAFTADEDGLITAEDESVCKVRGDVNFDGQISADDARLILRFAVELQTPSEEELLYANLDNNDELTAADARIALRIAVELDEGPSHISEEEIIIERATCYSTGKSVSRCIYCNGIFGVGIIPQRQHTGAGWEIIESSTCTKTGLKEMRCVYCDILLQTEVTPISGHIYGDIIYKGERDCTRMREVYRECINCDDINSFLMRPTSHTYVWTATTAPTCTDFGIEEQVCSFCGAIMPNTQQLLQPLGHIVPANWTVLQYPTETEDGLKIKTCTRCGEELQREIIPQTGETGEDTKTN